MSPSRSSSTALSRLEQVCGGRVPKRERERQSGLEFHERACCRRRRALQVCWHQPLVPAAACLLY